MYIFLLCGRGVLRISCLFSIPSPTVFGNTKFLANTDVLLLIGKFCIFFAQIVTKKEIYRILGTKIFKFYIIIRAFRKKALFCSPRAVVLHKIAVFAVLASMITLFFLVL